MSDKATPREWAVHVIPQGKYPTYHVQDEYGDVVAEWLCEANAKRIVRDHNSHEALVEALKGLLWLIDAGQLVESEPSHVGPITVSDARAALKLAEGEQP